MALRKIIFATATGIEAVGPVTETLKWGEPAYLTLQSKSGSTIRLGWKASQPQRYAMYFNCKTTLVDTFRTLFPNDFEFEGNRALMFNADAVLPGDAIKFCVAAALTYHLQKSHAAH